VLLKLFKAKYLFVWQGLTTGFNCAAAHRCWSDC